MTNFQKNTKEQEKEIYDETLKVLENFRNDAYNKYGAANKILLLFESYNMKSIERIVKKSIKNIKKIRNAYNDIKFGENVDYDTGYLDGIKEAEDQIRETEIKIIKYE